MRVDGRVIKEPGTQVDPDRQEVRVHGKPIPGASALRYYMVHKPVGYITTLSDPEGRPTVRQLAPPGPRLFPVGRLDADTSGLLLLTNDGDLAHHLMHPRYGVVKFYRALLRESPDEKKLRRLRSGVRIEPGVVTAPAEVRVMAVRDGGAAVEFRIQEGRNRQVRKMCEALGLSVRKLHRFGYGPLRLERLPKGASRPLTKVEISRLKASAARPGGQGPPPVPRPRLGQSTSRPGPRNTKRHSGPASRPPRGAGGQKTWPRGRH